MASDKDYTITINGETISTAPQDNVWVSSKDIPFTYTATTTDTLTVDTGYSATMTLHLISVVMSRQSL